MYIGKLYERAQSVTEKCKIKKTLSSENNEKQGMIKTLMLCNIFCKKHFWRFSTVLQP